MKRELLNINRIAKIHDTHKDFDKVLAFYTGKIIAPETKGKIVLEAGCSTGVMTPQLLSFAKELHIIEGSPIYAEIVKKKFKNKIQMTCSLFENYNPEKKFDVVVCAGVLHHLKNPEAVLKHAKKWLKEKGMIYISVPNMSSFHRELGVAMNISKTVYDPSKRNILFTQPGRFDKQRLEKLVSAAGYDILESYGFFFKPFPHEIMNKINLSEKILAGLFEMGKRYPNLACQLFVKAKKISNH
jgi:2-polyprenyl-3-methyl-5-hydroxy-6-metoxy-1,4-benzoquinol methylase